VALHPTISDKNRKVTLKLDGEWHPFTIRDTDGKVKTSIVVPPGIYILIYALVGKVTTRPSQLTDLRVQRYPVDPKDNGTAWDTLDAMNQGGSWHCTRSAKVEVKASGSYSTAIGIDYRGFSGALTCEQRILKFVRQRDE
jgi:hypothetical protein